TCIAMLEFGGLGHTLAVYAKDQAVLDAFFLEKPANRILVNGPASQGAVGYSTNLVPSMSLGCGPQAGNISSDNITARHLINIKRAAYLKRDWADLEKRDHARAAAMLGGEDPAPRGSGLPGDPALSGSAPAGASPRPTAASVDVRSNWQGNPPMSPRASAAPGPAAVTPVALRGKPAPSRFTRPSAPAIAVLARPAPPVAAPPRANPHVGSALSTSEILTLMQHAGAGCPMGPCKGCPHFEIPTGACLA